MVARSAGAVAIARVALQVVVDALAAALARVLREALVAPAAAEQERIVVDERAVGLRQVDPLADVLDAAVDERVVVAHHAHRVAEARLHDGVRVHVRRRAHVAVDHVVRKRVAVKVGVEVAPQVLVGLDRARLRDTQPRAAARAAAAVVAARAHLPLGTADARRSAAVYARLVAVFGAVDAMAAAHTNRGARCGDVDALDCLLRLVDEDERPLR
mmetsp:Transcript_1166/g.3033  ORF Transcript_1166/g.3033 Transcript_1166/m.3033 type:complete len:214 (-) Transcript_1166:99-740(-)